MHTHRNPPTQGRDASPSRPQHKVATPPSTPCLPLRRRGRDAFTLIEVLVASAILIVIVLIISMIFRQGAIAWGSGITRTTGIMQVRTLISGATHELRSSTAIISQDITAQNAYKVITETEITAPTFPGLVKAAEEAKGFGIDVKATAFAVVSPDIGSGTNSAVRIEVALSRTNSVSEIIGHSIGGGINIEVR